MEAILQEQQFDFISPHDRQFILAFDAEMTRLGYDCGGRIGPGYCWGKYMLIYTKTGGKSKNVYARIYLRETGIALRMFFSDVDKHRAFIENAPRHIKEAFTGPAGDCRHDKNEKDGKCKFRKIYTIDGRLIEKCNGETFAFGSPRLEDLPDYLALFEEFYPGKKARVLSPL